MKFTRGDAANVGEQLKLGEAELGIACPLHEPWERLESWVLFTERFELAVPKSHPLATRNSLILSQLGDTRLLPRAYCEQSQVLGSILSAHGLSHDFQDRIASDHDLMSLLAANVGLSFLPQSSLSLDTLCLVQVQDLELTRPVVLYAVSVGSARLQRQDYCVCSARRTGRLFSAATIRALNRLSTQPPAGALPQLHP